MATFGFLTEARADNLPACGGIFLDAAAAAKCEVVPTKTCTPKCELVAGEKVCAARLTTKCSSGCTATAEASCVTTCSETCVPGCTSAGGVPNCRGLCQSDCAGDCQAKCADAKDKGECHSSCAQCCSNECEDKCAAKEDTKCDPVCGTACSGSCDAKANITCQVSCQSDLFTTCKTEVVKECKDECTNTGAAIFCDGQFLATAGKLQACADDIKASFNVTLDVSVSASVSCTGDACTGKANADSTGTLGCAVGPNRSAGGSGMVGGLMALVGLGILRARRARRAA